MKTFKIQQSLFDYKLSKHSNHGFLKDTKSSQMILDKVNEIQTPINEQNLKLVNQQLIEHFQDDKIKSYSSQINQALARSAANVNAFKKNDNLEQPHNPLQKLRTKTRSSNSVAFSSKRYQPSLSQETCLNDDDTLSCQPLTIEREGRQSINQLQMQQKINQLQKQNELLTIENRELKKNNPQQSFYLNRIVQLEKEVSDLETILKDTLLQQQKDRFYQSINLYHKDAQSQKISILQETQNQNQNNIVRYKTMMESDDKENQLSSSFLSYQEPIRQQQFITKQQNKSEIQPPIPSEIKSQKFQSPLASNIKMGQIENCKKVQ